MDATHLLTAPRSPRASLRPALEAAIGVLLRFGRRWAEAQAHRAYFE